MLILFCDLDAAEIETLLTCNGKVIWDKMCLIQEEGDYETNKTIKTTAVRCLLTANKNG